MRVKDQGKILNRTTSRSNPWEHDYTSVNAFIPGTRLHWKIYNLYTTTVFLKVGRRAPGGAERLLGGGHVARGRYGFLESETMIQLQFKTAIPYS